MQIPNNLTEFYVGAAIDNYDGTEFKWTDFLLYMRSLKGEVPKTWYGRVGSGYLKEILEKYSDMESTNISVENESLMLLDTVDIIRRNVNPEETESNNILELEEQYGGSFWWLMSLLSKLEAHVHLTEEETTSITNMRFSQSTMTLYYSYKKSTDEWASKKIFWYTDTCHIIKELVVSVRKDLLYYNSQYHNLSKYILKEETYTKMEETYFKLTIDMTKAHTVTKVLKELQLATVKEFLIKDLMQIELTNMKILGATIGKQELEKMMGVTDKPSFKEYRATSEVSQVSNLILSINYHKPKRVAVDYLLKQEASQEAIRQVLETGDDSFLDGVANQLIEDYGLTVFTRDFYMGLVNSLRVDSEGLFNYQLHSHNMQNYRKESFDSNLNLHKERMQLFLHQYSFGEHSPVILMQGGEFRLNMSVVKEGYL